MGHKYDPDYAVHPGETVKECMAMYGMTPQTIVESCYSVEDHGRSGVSDRVARVVLVLLREGPINEGIARAFQSAFSVPAKFWIERQRIYDKRIAKIQGES